MAEVTPENNQHPQTKPLSLSCTCVLGESRTLKLPVCTRPHTGEMKESTWCIPPQPHNSLSLYPHPPFGTEGWDRAERGWRRRTTNDNSVLDQRWGVELKPLKLALRYQSLPPQPPAQPCLPHPSWEQNNVKYPSKSLICTTKRKLGWGDSGYRERFKLKTLRGPH